MLRPARERTSRMGAGEGDALRHRSRPQLLRASSQLAALGLAEMPRIAAFPEGEKASASGQDTLARSPRCQPTPRANGRTPYWRVVRTLKFQQIGQLYRALENSYWPCVDTKEGRNDSIILILRHNDRLIDVEVRASLLRDFASDPDTLQTILAAAGERWDLGATRPA